MKTFVIAEAAASWCYGVRHLNNAIQAIEVAKAAGASAVKFQWCSDPRAMEKRRHVPKRTYDILAWDAAWLPMLAAQCEQRSIEFMCTVFLQKDIETITPLVTRLKIASLEHQDLKFVRACIETRKMVIVSLGVHRDTNPSGGMHYPLNVSHQPSQLRLLQCTTAYPAPLDSLGLKLIATGRGIHGLSDHSGYLTTGALAVACGAEIVEVHFRLARTPKTNPDYGHSHSPEHLIKYITNIRQTEIMLGDGAKNVESCELSMLKHLVKT